MSADLLRRAAATMRREESPFFDALAEWLEDEASKARFGSPTLRADSVASTYLADPGPLPTEDA